WDSVKLPMSPTWPSSPARSCFARLSITCLTTGPWIRDCNHVPNCPCRRRIDIFALNTSSFASSGSRFLTFSDVGVLFVLRRHQPVAASVQLDGNDLEFILSDTFKW